MNEELRQNNFDVLRVLLAVLVALAHFNALSGLDSDFWILHLSSFAVDSFFIVSGYLVCLSFSIDSSLARYALRRLFRVYPLYILVVLCQAALLFSLDNSSFSELGWYLFSNALFMNFLAPTLGGTLEALNNHNAINGSLWTLKIEVGFYFFMPFLIFLVRRCRLGLMVAFYALSAVFFIYTKNNVPVLSEQLPSQMRFFILGMAVCFWGRGFLVSIRRMPLFRLYAVFVGCAMIMVIANGEIYYAFVYPVVVAVFVFGVAFMGKRYITRFELSYPIYILHFPIIQLGLYFGLLELGYIVFFLYVSILTFLLSYILNRYVELPSIAFGKLLIRRWL